MPSDERDFPPVLTAAMAAELLQVHVESLRRMVREGRVPCHRFPGGRELRFLRDELLTWLAAQPGQTVDLVNGR
jgi:excisionase family DNA binding protein